jgi:uncharacterized damage-inducible protein DinB
VVIRQDGGMSDTWTAPDVTRADEPFVADERTMLQGWLTWHRDTLLYKCAGLTAEQLALRAVEPSNLSLLGLVRHMADVERNWFRKRFAAEPIEGIYCTDASPDADLDDIDPATAKADYARLVAEFAEADRAVAGASLDQTFTHTRHGVMSLRWIYLHMIEEYARHNGHADLLRERIDGVTGA